MVDAVEPRDIELMRRLANGDEDAFLEFYRRHQGGLYRYAAHMTGRPEAAGDVVQETFLTLVRHAKKFDEEKGAPLSFVYGIARNHVRKFHEKENRYVPLVDETRNGQSGEWSGESTGPHANGNGRSSWNVGMNSGTHSGKDEAIQDSLERDEIVRLLRNAVLTLPDHYREPVTLCDLEGKSYSEAATLLECPVGTVRSRLNRARSILLEKLRPARVGAKALSTPPGGAK